MSCLLTFVKSELMIIISTFCSRNCTHYKKKLLYIQHIYSTTNSLVFNYILILQDILTTAQDDNDVLLLPLAKSTQTVVSSKHMGEIVDWICLNGIHTNFTVFTSLPKSTRFIQSFFAKPVDTNQFIYNHWLFGVEKCLRVNLCK